MRVWSGRCTSHTPPPPHAFLIYLAFGRSSGRHLLGRMFGGLGVVSRICAGALLVECHPRPHRPNPFALTRAGMHRGGESCSNRFFVTISAQEVAALSCWHWFRRPECVSPIVLVPWSGFHCLARRLLTELIAEFGLGTSLRPPAKCAQRLGFGRCPKDYGNRPSPSSWNVWASKGYLP